MSGEAACSGSEVTVVFAGTVEECIHVPLRQA